MRSKKTLVVIALAAFMLSCGTSKKVMRQGVGLAEREQSKPPSKRILYPKGHDSYEEYGAPSDQTLPKREVKDREQMKFLFTESENVRVPGINPLPTGGVLALSLDAMKGEFCYPLRGQFLSDYGMRSGSMHTGVDIKAGVNDTIRAAFDGVVRMSKLYSSYGNLVVIRHYEGFETLYSHNSKNLVKVNDLVKAGDPIALAGRTGRASTEHLHFEFRVAGEHLDPNKLIDVNAMKLRKGMVYVSMLGGELVAYNSPNELKEMEQQRIAAQTKPQPATPIAPVSISTPPTPAVAPTSTKPKSQSTTSQEQYHTVKQGDTLYAISLKYKTTVSKICALNGIKESAILRLNQKIRVK